ncbi:MAG: 5-formyltetrahydrofolate cyclo-ligase [uncultured Rubrobacteraceae bacterium]|uniref:5-formyltetrahydrofolate cyclo-ligase n=1 Tax=uncultured Rubrobacteraceae bacterium TaxID=349277 RepID=A0A6J4R348_9ACTN|nr:MAG: 5-formyltetrahydrofolate cyclo-ligase [uncultured Rubrobacteraceae bacterium]
MVEVSGSSDNSKQALRRRVLGRRDAMGEAEHRESSQTIVGKVLSLEAYRRAGVVMAYAGFGSEVRTEPFLRSVLEAGKRLVLPRVNRERGALDLYEVRDLARDLEAGVWGINEPKADPHAAADLGAVDLALIPGVAFDARGGRLGHGAGYYDKLLGGAGGLPPLVAGAFEVQVVDELPLDPHDVLVDLILTEKASYPPGALEVLPGSGAGSDP